MQRKTEWMLGWADGYRAFLSGAPTPWRGGDSPEWRVRPGQHWKQGYKDGYARAEYHKRYRVKVDGRGPGERQISN